MSVAMDTIAELFEHTSANVWLSSLANDKNSDGKIHPQHHATRELQQIDQFVTKWDQPKRGTFFCVSTILPDKSRSRDNVSDIIGLHADVDFKDIDEHPDDVNVSS